MAFVKRSTPPGENIGSPGSESKPVSRFKRIGKAATAVKSSSEDTGTGKVILASEYSEPVKDLGEVSWLLYGEKKIGKTSLASMFPSAVFMMFEPGAKGLRIKRNPVPNWSTFKKLVPQILRSSYQTVVIDTLDIAYTRCFDHICSSMGVEHPNEGSFGNVWKAIATEFSDTMDSLLHNKGVIFISHVDDKPFQKRTGGEVTKVIPSLAKAARGYAAGAADVIGYYGYYGDERLLTVQGSETLDAGHRLKYRFWVYEEGRTDEELFEVLNSDKEADKQKRSAWERIHSVPMGETEQEGYENLIAAFENRQTYSGEPEEYGVTLSNVPVKFKSKK